MSNRTSDCPPLLEPGEHVRSVDQLRELCVTAFPLSTKRYAIFDGFRKIVGMLEQQRIPCEVVVDGSYLTKEIDPDDIDFAVVVSPSFYESCNPEQRKLLDWIGDDKNIKREHLCDCYLCVDFKPGDSGWFQGICDREWWISLWSKSVIYKRVRGVAVVVISPEREQ